MMGLLAILGVNESLSFRLVNSLVGAASQLFDQGLFFPHRLLSLIFPLQRAEYSSLTGSPK